MKRAFMGFITTAAVIISSHAEAHHSFPSTYGEGREVTIEGDVVQFVYRNPHSFVQILTSSAGRPQERWSVEWDGRARLGQEGVTGTTLKAGDHLIITGVPGPKQDDHWLRLRSVVRPKDGWRWMGKVD